MRKLYRCISFLLILLLCFLTTQVRLGFRDDLGSQQVFREYYALPSHTVDVVCIGTSAVQRGWISPIAYKRHGIASYSLATASQPFCLAKHIMKEAIRTQKPKVFVIDLRGAMKNPGDMHDSFIRRVTDNMSDSLVRWTAINEALSYIGPDNEEIDVDDISYYIKLAKYHELYNPAKIPKEVGVVYYSGFAYYEPTYYMIKPQRDVGPQEKSMKIDKECKNILNDLLDYCDTIDSKVVFTLMPFAGSRKQLRKLNTVASIVEKRGYDCINFMDYEHRVGQGMDYSKIFYNRNHTNYYGSKKITTYICRYLRKNYNLPNRKLDIRNGAWDESSKAFSSVTKEKRREMYNKIKRREKRK